MPLQMLPVLHIQHLALTYHAKLNKVHSLHNQHIHLSRCDLYQLGRRLVTCTGYRGLHFRQIASIFHVTYSVVFHVLKVRI